MRFRATLTNFRKDFQLHSLVFCGLFTRPTRTAEVTKPLGSRAYRAQKPHASNSPSLQNTGPVLARFCVNQRNVRCNEDPCISYPPQEEKSSRHVDHSVNTDPPPGTVRPTPPPILPPVIPSTKWELYQEILRLISLNPPAPFSRLMNIHQRHLILQSVESYNLLLQLSIRHHFSRYTRLLIKSMALNHIEPNANTEKLVVRYLITSGNWKQAWQQTVTRYTSVADIPMPVLLELLAPGTRHFLKPNMSRPLSRQLGHQPESVRGDTVGPKIPLDTLIIILHRFPRLPLNELARLPLRIISYAVRGLIRNGHHDEAVVLTENHLKTISPDINSKWLDFARDLIHLHLSSGEIKLANYKKRRRLVEHLFSLCPRLCPNSKTVFLLMRYLERSKRCGIEAYLFYKDYRARYGALVESAEVRRRIIGYAIKQRKFGIAKEISVEGPLEDPLPSRQKVIRRSPNSLLHVRAWRTMYPREGTRSRFWRRVVIRVLGKRRGRERLWKRGGQPFKPQNG